MTYAVERLQEEIAYVAYHFHWSLSEILDLEHATRRRFVSEIAKINERLSEPAGAEVGKYVALAPQAAHSR